jgi:hypothetical protein
MIYAYVYGYGGLRDEGDQKHATTVMVTTRGGICAGLRNGYLQAGRGKGIGND